MKKTKKHLSVFGCIYMIALLAISIAIILISKYTAGSCNVTDIAKQYNTAVKELENEHNNPGRDNTLYYAITDKGNRYDFDKEYQDYIWDKCVEYDIKDHYKLIIALTYHESKFDASLKSSTNDYGLMQINVCNHNWLKQTLGVDDLLDPYNNLHAGIYMMSLYLLKYNDVHTALMCYNMGEGGARKTIRNGSSSTYYSRGVVSDMNKLRILEQ